MVLLSLRTRALLHRARREATIETGRVAPPVPRSIAVGTLHTLFQVLSDLHSH